MNLLHLCVTGLASWLALCAPASAAASPGAYRVTGDGIPESFTNVPGDPSRGASIAAGRDANCLLCHSIPGAAPRMGNVGPPLDAVGSRLTAAQLRLRLADSLRLNPASIMPSYYKTEGLVQVASAYRGKPVLEAQQIEDLIAYLETIR
jgi:L-cysteine S-thiosulfotransferase